MTVLDKWFFGKDWKRTNVSCMSLQAVGLSDSHLWKKLGFPKRLSSPATLGTSAKT